MSTTASKGLLLKAAGLGEKQSTNGNGYFVGRLAVRVLIIRNRDAGAEGETDWHLFFADGDKPRRASADANPAGCPPRSYGARRAYHQPAAPAVNTGEMPDDPLDDIGRGP